MWVQPDLKLLHMVTIPNCRCILMQCRVTVSGMKRFPSVYNGVNLSPLSLSVSLLLAVSVCHKLELERQQHNQLKHTWQRANDQFLESQRLLMRDMQRIESVLSSEQLRQVEEMKKKDQVCTHTSVH